jgi:hypothetical protein
LMRLPCPSGGLTSFFLTDMLSFRARVHIGGFFAARFLLCPFLIQSILANHV